MATPRKNHRTRTTRPPNHVTPHVPASLAVLPSDYDSETVDTCQPSTMHGGARSAHAHDGAPTTMPTQRTNEQLNLAVLQRYHPDVVAILSIAPSATIYTFDGAWERSGIEGTLFVCALKQGRSPRSGSSSSAAAAAATPRLSQGYCVVILNRRALDNLILDVQDVEHVEVKDDYLILRIVVDESASHTASGTKNKTLGVFMHADKVETRHVNNLMVKQCWDRIQAEVAERREASSIDGSSVLGDGVMEPGGVPEGAVDVGLDTSGGMMNKPPGFGRRVSITDLFGR